MTIVVLYIILVLSVVVVLGISTAVFMKVRKSMRDKSKPTDTGLFPPRDPGTKEE